MGVAVLFLLLVALAVAYYVQRRAKARRAWQARIRTLAGLMSLTPRGFEYAVRDILAELGWQVSVVGGPGDRGADIRGLDSNGRSVVVQAKQLANGSKVGSPPIQSLLGAQTIHGATVVMLVTTADFTRPAVDLAREYGVRLVDGHQLADLAQRAFPPPVQTPSGGVYRPQPSPSLAPAGWYPYPGSPTRAMRWWDGTNWTGWSPSTVQPPSSLPGQPPAPPPGTPEPRAPEELQRPSEPEVPSTTAQSVTKTASVARRKPPRRASKPKYKEGQPPLGRYGFTPDFEAFVGRDKAQEMLAKYRPSEIEDGPTDDDAETAGGR